MLGISSYWRSVYTIRAWKEGGFGRLILSGKNDITAPMRDFIVFQGIPASVVVMEDRSNSTTRKCALHGSGGAPVSGTVCPAHQRLSHVAGAPGISKSRAYSGASALSRRWQAHEPVERALSPYLLN